jgi:hypothetical protein
MKPHDFSSEQSRKVCEITGYPVLADFHGERWTVEMPALNFYWATVGGRRGSIMSHDEQAYILREHRRAWLAERGVYIEARILPPGIVRYSPTGPIFIGGDVPSTTDYDTAQERATLAVARTERGAGK